MPRHRVLIVEDEHDIAGLIKHTLERGGDAEAQIVGTGDAALKAVAAAPPDLIILDLNLPVLSGLEVCRILRGRPDGRHLPIIMLTARTSEDDRVSGLELGADDYVTKPFSLRELTARVRAVLRRSSRPDDAAADHLPRRPPDRRLRRGRRRRRRRSDPADPARVRAAPLPGQNKNRVVSRDRLLERVWGYDRLVETRSVDVHVGRLRSKLGDGGPADRDGRRPRLPVHRLSFDHPPAGFLQLQRFTGEQRERALHPVPVLVVVEPLQLRVLLEPYFPAQHPGPDDGISTHVIGLAQREGEHGVSDRKAGILHPVGARTK